MSFLHTTKEKACVSRSFFLCFEMASHRELSASKCDLFTVAISEECSNTKLLESCCDLMRRNNFYFTVPLWDTLTLTTKCSFLKIRSELRILLSCDSVIGGWNFTLVDTVGVKRFPYTQHEYHVSQHKYLPFIEGEISFIERSRGRNGRV